MDKIAPLLEILTSKLGTTTEHLWVVLINSMRHEAYAGLMAMSLFGIVFLILNLFAKKQWAKHIATVQDANYRSTGEPTSQQCSCWLIWGFTGVYIFILFISLSTIYMQLAAPEAMALKTIINLLK